jgi:hypothetical protein
VRTASAGTSPVNDGTSSSRGFQSPGTRRG